MSGEVIDEMTAIIASLNSRLEELDHARKLCTCGSEGKANDGNSSDAGRNIVVTDDVMYQGIIDTLTKQNDELTRNNEKLTGQVRELTTENTMLTRKYETLSAEYQIAVCTQYCTVCREDTHHENNFCIQCLIIEQDNPKDNVITPVPYNVEEQVNSALSVAMIPTAPVDNASVQNTSGMDEKQGEEFSISRDELIAGYQKVILALTHRLAEAYGVSEK